MARATHPPPSMVGPASAVARPFGAPEATCCRAQEPARPGLVGPARSLEGASCDKAVLLPASILGITDIRVKGTLTDTEPRQVQIYSGLRRSRPYHDDTNGTCATGRPGIRVTQCHCPSILLGLRAGDGLLGDRSEKSGQPPDGAGQCRQSGGCPRGRWRPVVLLTGW